MVQVVYVPVVMRTRQCGDAKMLLLQVKHHDTQCVCINWHCSRVPNYCFVSSICFAVQDSESELIVAVSLCGSNEWCPRAASHAARTLLKWGSLRLRC